MFVRLRVCARELGLWSIPKTDMVCCVVSNTKGQEVGGWGGDPKKCTGSIWGMGSSTI